VGANVTPEALAFWVRAPGVGEIRPVTLPVAGPDDVVVRTLRSAVSRGTETLVFKGSVPPSQYDTMRAPFQDGEFPGPVKYGYLNVGVVEQGPVHLKDRVVFCLYPHQTRYVVPASSVVPVPEQVPVERAVLAGTVETAVNALWEVAPLVGDRIAVMGAGMVGACVARLMAQIPGVEVTLVDINPDREKIAVAMGSEFATPDRAPAECDTVVHTTATSQGLGRSLELLAPDGTVVELSWYGDQSVALPLGEAFHSKRLTIRASQVGAVAAARRDRHSPPDRRALALDLLRDPAYDVLLTGTSPFQQLPQVMTRLVDGTLSALCHSISYDHE
jgi:threonine dehydrogenase-like Zn-dependent dehydrogenase